MDRDLVRQGAVVAAVLAGIASGATGDYGDAEDSESLVIPSDYAFAIWAPVYAGSLAYAAHQARPGERTNALARRTGWPAASAYLLAGTWIRLQRRPAAQVPLIAVTMGATAVAYARSRPASGEVPRRVDTWAVRAPLGLFAGG